MSHQTSLLITAEKTDLGGFFVRRVLPYARRRMVSPFIFFDHIGPVDFAPGQGIDVRPHPHVCLATITYLFAGEILHRDSLGYVQSIHPGEINLMIAGRGIVHSERTSEEKRAGGQTLHGIQSWIALPKELEETEPTFENYSADCLPVIEQDGCTMRLLMGTAYGQTSPVKICSPMFYLDVQMDADAVHTLLDEYTERAIYVVEGSVIANGEVIEMAQMRVFAADETVQLQACETSRVMLLGGATLGERHIWWNFVASDKARIERAKMDWKAGHFAKIPDETELMPLPE